MRAWPTSPSFESFSSDGDTTVSSCRMIEAVMYGMIPSANSAIRLSPPPENRLRKLRIPPLDRKSTRLNSSHQIISYAVFCLKKKKKKKSKTIYKKTQQQQNKND